MDKRWMIAESRSKDLEMMPKEDSGLVISEQMNGIFKKQKPRLWPSFSSFSSATFGPLLLIDVIQISKQDLKKKKKDLFHFF
jgi:hypothetical protein